MLTEAEVVAMLREKVKAAGKMKPVADEFGVTIAYVSDTLRGRRAPGPAILEGLGLEKVIAYRPAAN